MTTDDQSHDVTDTTHTAGLTSSQEAASASDCPSTPDAERRGAGGCPEAAVPAEADADAAATVSEEAAGTPNTSQDAQDDTSLSSNPIMLADTPPVQATCGELADEEEEDEVEGEYCGLVNLGSTCYLNSLVQCLFHLPYFRGQVYNMKRDVEQCLPSALQLLFHTMEQNKGRPASTKHLTDSFGWNPEELATQQDLHEMCIKLREKLEEKMKGTDADGSVKHLFHGVVDSVVQTLDGSYESVTRDSFYELQLDIQGKAGVYDALTELVKPERLDGNNKYKVEGTDGNPPQYKEADKFLRYRKFPPVQIIHLKRFEIDYYSENLEQRKLYDRFAYPEVLDLTAFENPLPPGDTELDPDDPLFDRDTPAIYHAHSVIVHCGGPRVGHYYAYVRPDLKASVDAGGGGDGWFEFDDTSVTPASLDSVFESSFGGKTWVNSWGVEQVVTATSYILFYVRESCVEPIFRPPSAIASPPEGIMRAYLLERAKAREDERLTKQACKLVFLQVIREGHIRHSVDENQTGLYSFPSAIGQIFVKRAGTLRALRNIIEKTTGVAPQCLRLWAWGLFDRSKRQDGAAWRAPLLEPTDPDDMLVQQRWAAILPKGEVCSLNVLVEEPRPACDFLLHYGNPTFPPDGVNVAYLGQARQTTTYCQPKKGISHPASNALLPDRTYSQTSLDDVAPCFTLTLPASVHSATSPPPPEQQQQLQQQDVESMPHIRKIVLKNRSDTAKFTQRFQNLNISVYCGKFAEDRLTYDYQQRDVMFGPAADGGGDGGDSNADGGSDDDGDDEQDCPDRAMLFNPRNTMGCPSEWVLDFSDPAAFSSASRGEHPHSPSDANAGADADAAPLLPPVRGDRIVVRKDNSDFPPPPPPPPPPGAGAAARSPLYQYQKDFDEEQWGYSCQVERGAWARNRALALNCIEVWVDPPPPPVPLAYAALEAADEDDEAAAVAAAEQLFDSPGALTILPFSPAWNSYIMVKCYNPQTGRLHFLGSMVVHQQELVQSIQAPCLHLLEKHTAADDRSVFYAASDEEEEEDDDDFASSFSGNLRGNVMLFYCEVSGKRAFALDGTQTFCEQYVFSGACVTFQLYNKRCDAFAFPFALAFYEHLADVVVVHFEPLLPEQHADPYADGASDAASPPLSPSPEWKWQANGGRGAVQLELSASSRCMEITELLGREIGADPAYIQLRVCLPWTCGGVVERRCENRTLREMVTSATGATLGAEGVVCLYYQVLTGTTAEEEQRRVTFELMPATQAGVMQGCCELTLTALTSVLDIVGLVRAQLQQQQAQRGDDGPPVFAGVPDSAFVLLEIENHAVKDEFYSDDTLSPDAESHYELRPVPPPFSEHPADQQLVVNVVQFTDAQHSWTGRSIAERHSSPIQCRVAPDETWEAVLDRYVFYLCIQSTHTCTHATGFLPSSS